MSRSHAGNAFRGTEQAPQDIEYQDGPDHHGLGRGGGSGQPDLRIPRAAKGRLPSQQAASISSVPA